MSPSKPAATRNPLWRCFTFYRAVPGLFFSVTVALTLINLAQPLSQWLIGLALHDVQLGKAVLLKSTGALDFSRAWHWAAVLLGFVLVRSLIQYFATIFSTYLGQGLLFHLRDLVLSHLQTLDLAYHQAHGAGEIINRATRDSDKIRDAVVGGYRTILELTMVVLGTLALLFYYNPLLAAVPALLIAIAIFLARSQADKLVDLDRKTDHAYDRVAQDLSEGVHGVRVIKAFALESVRIGRFKGRIGEYV
ncbi:MAG: ABC transporter ATP-binding protein, partial [Spirochaetia bacterium]|nr:ABC transporter ATP-binding protein [Spirochaetia bacterium]